MSLFESVACAWTAARVNAGFLDSHFVACSVKEFRMTVVHFECLPAHYVFGWSGEYKLHKLELWVRLTRSFWLKFSLPRNYAEFVVPTA